MHWHIKVDITREQFVAQGGLNIKGDSDSRWLAERPLPHETSWHTALGCELKFGGLGMLSSSICEGCRRDGQPIGRIGGLAAALGVGAVILAAPAIADTARTDAAQPPSRSDGSERKARVSHQLNRGLPAMPPTSRNAIAESANPQPAAGSGLLSKESRVSSSVSGGSTARSGLVGRSSAKVTSAPAASTGHTGELSATTSDTPARITPQLRAANTTGQQVAPSFGDILTYTLFHKAPTANPSQNPDQSVTGVVTGRLNVASGNAANVLYSLAGSPANGDVTLNQDGSYIYTPNLSTAMSGGTDKFSVAIDNGSAYRLTGIGGAIQSIFAAFAQLVGLRQPDSITVEVPVSVGSTVKTISVGPEPFAVEVSPDGRRVYVSIYGDDTVAVIDTTTATEVQEIAVGPASCADLCKGPASLALSPDGKLLYAAGGYIPVFNEDGSLQYFDYQKPLAVIDTSSGVVIDRIDLGFAGGGESNMVISPDGQSLYLGLNGWGSGQPYGIRVLDIATQTMKGYLGVTSYLVALSDDSKTIVLNDWVRDNLIYAFDTATNTQLWSTEPKIDNMYFATNSIAVSGDRVYASLRGGDIQSRNGGVAILNAENGDLIAFVPTGTGEQSPNSVAASADGTRVYVVDATGVFSVIDTATANVIGTTNFGGSPWAVAVSPDNKYAYVTDREGGSLWVVPV